MEGIIYGVVLPAKCTGTVLNSAVKLQIPYVKIVQKGNFQSYLYNNKTYMLQVCAITCIYTKKNKITTGYKMSFSQSHKPKNQLYCS